MRILIADDNRFYRHALKSVLAEWGYEVIEGADGAEAWAILQGHDAPKIAILDWMLSRLGGPELCRMVRSLPRPEPTHLIILTSLEGKQCSIGALDAGADDFIRKPFDWEELRARLRVGQRIVGLQTSQMAIFTFARAVEAKSPYTQGHAERVTLYAGALAASLGVPDVERETLRRGALLHDIGKIGIPDTLLNKPGDLTPEEYELIKQHPSQGAELVKPLRSLEDTVPLIRWHHERLDGTGYPDGLAGAAIPFLVRILSVADVYDALRSERPYRLALSHEQCLRIMSDNAAGGGLDPDLVRAFAKVPTDALRPVAERPALADARRTAPGRVLQTT